LHNVLCLSEMKGMDIEMNDRKTICILGGTGVVGRAAYMVLRNLNYYFKIGVHNISKVEKEDLYRTDNVELFEIDLNNFNRIESLCKGIDLVIGAIGPSTRYSEKMLQLAIKVGTPYVDPGGIHLKRKYRNEELEVLAIVGAGVFPGLSGWLLHSEIERHEEEYLYEIAIGGEYNFTRGAAIDYAEETKNSASGIPMACIRKSTIVAAERMRPTGVPDTISELVFLPYVTEEIQEILKNQRMLNIDSYTVASDGMFNAMRKLRGKENEIIAYLTQKKYDKQRAIIWIKKSFPSGNKTVLFEGNDPGKLTGKILAISADEILHRENKKGIYLMANYLSDFSLLDNLKEIEDFRYER